MVSPAEMQSGFDNLLRFMSRIVQHVCNLLFESEQQIIDNELIDRIFYQVLTSFEPLYSGYRRLIPHHQYKLLQAIASEDGTNPAPIQSGN